VRNDETRNKTSNISSSRKRKKINSYGSCVFVSAAAGLLKRIRIPKCPEI
jgi:hypothetical protein